MLVNSSAKRAGHRTGSQSCRFGNGLLERRLPEAKRIGLFEWFYRSVGADVDFLKQGPVESDRALRLRTWNVNTS